MSEVGVPFRRTAIGPTQGAVRRPMVGGVGVDIRGVKVPSDGVVVGCVL